MAGRAALSRSCRASGSNIYQGAIRQKSHVIPIAPSRAR